MTGTPYAYYPPEASIAPCSLCLRQHRAGSQRLLARPGSRLQFLADQFCTKGTEGSNPCTLQGGYRLVGIVDWPDRAGLPGVTF